MKAILFCGLAAAAAASPALADNYAQQLLRAETLRHPQVATLAIHATPPKAQSSALIATAKGTSGSAGAAYELPLQDVSGDVIGMLSVTLAPGAPATLAETIRNELKRQVINVANLMDAVPYVPQFPSSPYAQMLVDDAMRRHPDLLVLAMHVANDGGDDYPIIASNIGRIGKPADSDDRHVISTQQPKMGAYGANLTRFGVELPMYDQGGRLLGALALGFPYRQGDDQQALLARAQTIEAELRQRIPSQARLHDAAN
ncbi:MAG: hypothetical protein V4724_13405 [Pseudomonadota bacterium]